MRTNTSRKSLATGLLIFILAAGAAAESLVRERGEPIRAAVYTGDGASAACVTETYEALRIDGDITPSLIGPTGIFTGGLDDIDVLVFPGGSGSRQMNSLGSISHGIVRRFVIEDGKGVVGICAGGYLVSDSPGYPCLGLIGADTVDRDHDKRGSALVEISFTDEGLSIFPEMRGYERGYIQYHDGPLFVPPEDDDYSSCEELAVNNSDVHHTGSAPEGMTPGKSLFLVQESGKGRVFACAGHPESTAGMRWMVPRMVRWAARRELVPYPATVTRPWLGEREIMHSDERETELYWRIFDEDPDTRIEAIRALRADRYRNGFRWAAGMIRDVSPDVRGFAAEVLAEAGYTAAIEDLDAVIAREKDPACMKRLEDARNRLASMIGH